MEPLIERFEKINLLAISRPELTKWIRENVTDSTGRAVGLGTSYSIAQLIIEAHKLGVIRGKILTS